MRISLMMKLFNILAIAATAAVAIVSCAKEETPAPVLGPELQFSSEEAEEGTQSKTHWTGSTIWWSKGDKIAVAYADAGVWKNQFFVSNELADDSHQATFVARTTLAENSKGSFSFYGLYPAIAVSDDFSACPSASVLIPSVQTPSVNSYDPSGDLMYGYSIQSYSTTPSEPVSMFWRRLVAHADITLTLPQMASGEIVEKVEFTVNDGLSLSGDFCVDMSTGKMAPSASDSPANTVTAIADNLDFTDGQVHVWLSVAPCRFSSLKVVITTDIATYTRDIASCDVNFAVNKRNLLSVDMTSAERQVKTDEDKDALINPRIFSLLDLDMPELAKVKYYYEAGLMYEAAEELVEYFRNREGLHIWNYESDPNNVTITTTMQRRADKALKENGYRFYVGDDYLESADPVEYYSFDQNNDGIIEWDYSPVEVNSFTRLMYRHPWVGSLKSVYYKYKDEKYAECITQVFLDWLRNHPCPYETSGTYVMGMSHPSYRIWCNLASSIRSTSYLGVLDELRSSVHYTPEFLTELLLSFYDSAESIRHNYYYAEASNIRLTEVQGVLYIAVLLPEFIKSKEWLDETVAATNRLLDMMMEDDGCLVEKDMHYHVSVLSTFYGIQAQLAATGHESLLPDDYFSKLSNSTHLVRDIMYPDYSIEGLNETRPENLSKNDLIKNFKKYVKMLPEDKTLLWASTQGKEGVAPTELLSIYPNAGYYMFRTGWTKDDTMLILSNNENYYGYAHCQPDNGTVALYRKGRRFLPDAGCYTYGGTAELDAERAEFRATKNHNTLTLNEADAANDIAGQAGLLVGSVSNDDYDMVHVSNQSYENLKHDRWVYHLKDGVFVIVDVADGTAAGSVELNWHLGPDSNVAYARSGNAYECRTGYGDSNNMVFKTFCFNGTGPNSSFLAETGKSWYSDAIYVKEERPCHQVAVTKSEEQQVRFVTVIYPFSDTVPDITAMFNSSDMITVLTGDKYYLLYL